MGPRDDWHCMSKVVPLLRTRTRPKNCSRRSLLHGSACSIRSSALPTTRNCRRRRPAGLSSAGPPRQVPWARSLNPCGPPPHPVQSPSCAPSRWPAPPRPRSDRPRAPIAPQATDPSTTEMSSPEPPPPPPDPLEIPPPIDTLADDPTGITTVPDFVPSRTSRASAAKSRRSGSRKSAQADQAGASAGKPQRGQNRRLRVWIVVGAVVGLLAIGGTVAAVLLIRRGGTIAAQEAPNRSPQRIPRPPPTARERVACRQRVGRNARQSGRDDRHYGRFRIGRRTGQSQPVGQSRPVGQDWKRSGGGRSAHVMPTRATRLCWRQSTRAQVQRPCKRRSKRAPTSTRQTNKVEHPCGGP